MPIIWLNFPTGSSTAVKKRAGKPKTLEAYVRRLVKKADPNADLEDLYFEVGAERAYAVVKDLDNYVDVKAVASVLGATSATKLLDVAGGQAGEILGRPPERGEYRPSRLVRQRDCDLGPRGQRLEQRPLRAGEVLEPVGEDRLAVPRFEVGPQSLDGVTAQQATVPAC